MVRTMQTLVLAVSMLAVMTLSSATAVAQDQESGAIDFDPSPRPSRRASRSEVEQVAPGPLRLYGGLSIAAGGELKSDDYDEGPELFPTIGFQVGMDFVVMDYFSVGGETRFLFPKIEDLYSDDRDFLWDLAVKPRGRYAFDTMPLEIYLATPIGLTVPGLHGELEGKAGWNVGIVAGANWFFSENLGVNLELGWQFHKFGVEDEDEDYTVRMNQFVFLSPSFVYAL